MNLGFDDVPVKHLMTGECYIGTSPTLVSTVLGSCVAVTLFSPLKSIGAVCHGFLPTLPDHLPQQLYLKEVCKFVDSSVEFMVGELAYQGCPPHTLEAKVFGGANGLMSNRGRENGMVSVGEKNVDTAYAMLDEFGINILVSDVGGSRGRKLLFLTHTGGVWIKRLGAPMV